MELDMILYLYDMPFFRKEDFNYYGNTMSWDKKRFYEMIKKGLIKEWRPGKEQYAKAKMYELSHKAKSICRELGFKTNSPKFADCSLKMMSLQFETGNKTSNNDGSTTQQIIVKQQDDFDVGDFFFGLQKIIDDNYRSTTNSSSTSSTRQNCKIYERQWGAEVVCQ